MTDKNYCMVNKQTAVCDNIILWSGNTQDWTPPSGYLMRPQESTPAKIWELNQEETDYVLTVVPGAGDIGFTWDGTYLVTNQPKPEAPVQPTVEGAQTL